MTAESPTRDELLTELAEARKSETFLRQVVENLREAVFTTDRQGNFTWVCPNAEVIFDMTAEDIRALGSIDKLLGSDLLLPGELERAGSIINRECRVRDRQGTVHWLLVDMKKILVNGGHNLFSCRDITARKEAEEEVRRLNEQLEKQVEIRTLQLEGMLEEAKRENQERRKAQEALRASEEKHRSLLETLLYGVCVIQEDRVVFANPALCRMSGYSRDEILAFTAEDIFDTIISDRDRARVKENFARRVGGEPADRSYTALARHRDGAFRHISIDGSLVDFDGTPAVQIVVQDVTERKVAEERLRMAAGVAADLIYEWDAVTDRLDWYGDVDGALGCAPGEISNHVEAWVSRIHPEDQKMMRTAIEAHRESTEPIHYVYRIQRKDGTWRHWQDRAAPVLNEEGKPLRWVGACLDVTEQKEAEEEARVAHRELRNLTAHLERIREEERARIAKAVHDELGQELTALKLDLAWLGKKMLAGEEKVRARITSMKDLTNGLVQTVKRIVSDLRPGVLDELGLAAAAEWQVRDFQERTGVRASFRVEPREIIMEKERAEALFRILQETLTNVARHAEAAEVKVSLSERTGRVNLMVQDDGRGFDSDAANPEQAFGLAGLRERATYLGGGVVVESKPGKGTRVWVNVPATKEDAEEEE